MEQHKIDEVVCTTCWDVILGPNVTKGAEFYGINFKKFCSLSCYDEYDKKVQEEALKAQNVKQAPTKKKKSKKDKRRK